MKKITVLMLFFYLSAILVSCINFTPEPMPLEIEKPAEQLDFCKDNPTKCLENTNPTFCEQHFNSSCCLGTGTDAVCSQEPPTNLESVCQTQPSNPWCPTAEYCSQNQLDEACKVAVNKLSHTEFINYIGSRACLSYQQTGVPPSVTIAQSILETGWGKSTIEDSNNLFGIKCRDGNCIEASTTECSNGNCLQTMGKFQKYSSFDESITEHAKLLATPRYAYALEAKDDPDEFARRIHDAGYATDPKYDEKLISLMKQNNLYRFNEICK